jgi:hypothetical protein
MMFTIVGQYHMGGRESSRKEGLLGRAFEHVHVRPDR